MAKAGDEIFNPRTGQRMIFLETGTETNGELLRNESYNPPAGDAEPEHVHPFQESGAEVLSGSVSFRVGSEERSLKAGESITIPANTPHFFWNDGDEEAHFIGWFRPALKIDRFFESFFGLAQDGKLNEKGLPSFWQLAVMVPHFGDEIRLTSPPCRGPSSGCSLRSGGCSDTGRSNPTHTLAAGMSPPCRRVSGRRRARE